MAGYKDRDRGGRPGKGKPGDSGDQTPAWDWDRAAKSRAGGTGGAGGPDADDQPDEVDEAEEDEDDTPSDGPQASETGPEDARDGRAAQDGGAARPRRRRGPAPDRPHTQYLKTWEEWSEVGMEEFMDIAHESAEASAVAKRALLSLKIAMWRSFLKIEWCREARGMSIQELDRRLGLPPHTWSRIKNKARRDLPPEIIPRAQIILKIRPEFLAVMEGWEDFPESERLLPWHEGQATDAATAPVHAPIPAPVPVPASTPVRASTPSQFPALATNPVYAEAVDMLADERLDAKQSVEVVDMGIACWRQRFGLGDVLRFLNAASLVGGARKLERLARAAVAPGGEIPRVDHGPGTANGGEANGQRLG